MPEASPPRQLGLADLVFFNISAIVGIRWLAAAGHSGPGSVTLWLLAAGLFFVPSAVVVTHLARLMPEEGGIYRWTGHAFGDWHAFLCGFCYWTNNLFYLPSLSVAGATMALYIFGPPFQALETSRAYGISASLFAIWSVTLANIGGLNIGKWIGNAGGACIYLAGALLVILGFAAYVQSGSATALEILPRLDWDRVNFWPQIAFAFGGFELSAILAGEIRQPERAIRRAVWISGFAIAAFYVAGTLAVLVLLPSPDISVVNGLTQAGFAAAQRFGLPWLSPLVALLITFAIAGQLGSWVAGCARLPMVAGIDRLAPPSFARLHPRWRTPHISLLVQAGASSLFLLAMHLGDDLRTSYQLLVDMAVITYFIPFVYLFLAAWKLGLRLAPVCGLFVTSIAIAFSFVPPGGVASWWLFEAKLIGGAVLLILAARLYYRCLLGVRPLDHLP